MTLPITIFLIYDMSASLSDENIDIINNQNNSNYPYGVTYQMLYDSRTKERGYFKHKEGKKIWVLPDLYYGQNTDNLDISIGEQVTEKEYLTIHLPTFDL
tara:strand:- start:293 stop:592 length:300 start_codon:yes stop_codon:yes gene_type:complete